MNLNRHRPERERAITVSDVENRLRGLEPWRVTFDAKSILAAAADTRCSSPPIVPTSAEREQSSKRWRTIVVSWTCGLAVGVLLMLALAPSSQTNSVPAASGQQHPPNDGRATNDEGTPIDPRDRDTARQVGLPRIVTTEWSQADREIASQFLDLRRPGQAGAPLTPADSYKVVSSRMSLTADRDGRFAMHASPPRQSSPSRRTIPRSTHTPTTIDPDALLRELLGGQPASRL